MAVDKTLTLEEAMRRAALAANAASVEGTDVRRSKAYLEAKEKIKARYQPFMNDTPYGMKQKALYEKELADLDRDMGVTGSGINTLPGASSSGTVPAAGTVMNGYKFKGGNPADKNNWEKV
jgi:hypothetical protein